MQALKMNLWPEQADGTRPVLETYILDKDGDRRRKAVLVLPGGGYGGTSLREAEPVALQFTAAGFHAFILHYRVARRDRHPAPILDVARAICLIREHADEWALDPDGIAVCGFSAGGHLAASIGVHWNNEKYMSGVPGVTIGQNKPNAMILSYPVITSGPKAHVGSIQNLVGPTYGTPEGAELTAEMSLENQVSSATPPAFIWHTFADTVVPVENALMFATALREHNIPFELHIYPKGDHGYSTATIESKQESTLPPDPHIGSWVNLCVEWLNML